MNILTIPLRNLRRKLARSILLTVVFGIGILSVVGIGYVSREVGDSIERKLTQFGANILVSPKVETLGVSYGGLSLGNVSFDLKYLDSTKTVETIRSIHHKDRISAVAPKLVSLLESSAGRWVGVIGVEWDEEQLIKSYWSTQGKIPQDPDEVLVGAKAAATLALAQGGTVSLSGREFTVSGVLDPTGSEDDNVIFMGLPRLQSLTGRPGQANFVEVAALCSACPIEEIVEQIQEKLPGVEIAAMQKVVKSRMYTIDFVKKLALTVSLVLLITACAMISLSLLASVNERKHEIGVLRALGYSRFSVFGIFCLEALVMGFSAAFIGYFGGFWASRQVLSSLDLGADALSLNFEFTHLLATLVLVSLVSCLSSVIPAWKAANTDPAQALTML